MVTAHDLRMDKRPLELRTQRGADEKIIQAPADIPCSRAPKLAPPRVMSAAFLKLAEGVHKTRVDKRAETRPFFRRKTVVFHVCLRVGEIYFRVCHVQVAAKDHRLALFELLQKPQEVSIPLLPILQP